jgi:site-specific DNA recombinase
MRIAIYSRKSVDTDTGESIKNQISFCKQYFERGTGKNTFEVFQDEGFSGKNTNRPAFQRMMELIAIKQFDIVAVYKVDRIARNVVDFVNTFDELEKFDVKLISITEGFDPSTPIGKMMMMLLASFAEMERLNTVQRVKDNMRELAKMGRWSGGTSPYGYDTEKIDVDSKHATFLKPNNDIQNVKEIFQKYSSGHTAYQISKVFNISSKTISNILVNPTYLISTTQSIEFLKAQGYTVYGEPNGKGFLPYNRRPKTKGRKSWNDKSKFVGISKHEGIIDLDLWIKVQETLKSKAISPHPRESDFTFLTGGIMKCSCGSGMFVSQGRTKKDGSRIYYFRCSGKKDGSNCSNSRFLRVDDAEEAVENYLKSISTKTKLVQRIQDYKSEIKIESKIKDINKKISSNSKAINNLIDKLSMFTNDSSIGIVTKKIDDLSQKNNELNEDLLKLQREKLLEQRKDLNIDALYLQIQKFLGNDLNLETKKILIKTIIDTMTWYSEEERLDIKLLV